jgi:tRNA-dihydrouridine synthase
VNGDIRTCTDAVDALVGSGADAVMVGRAVQGRPWLPGQFAHYLATGISVGAPALSEQFDLIDALYDEMLNHYGCALGRRHARKHLGWGLDAAAASARVPVSMLKFHRTLYARKDNDDLSQRAQLAHALYVSTLAAPGQKTSQLTEAAALMDGLPPAMRRLNSVNVWRDWIAEEQKKRH